MKHFALADDGYVYDLCDCGDFEAAEESATDLGIHAIWIADEDTAIQWMDLISRSLGFNNA
jgi:hypothetical protein